MWLRTLRSDFWVIKLGLGDVDYDDRLEAILSTNSREVLIVNLEDGTILRRLYVPSIGDSPLIADIDGDGKVDICVGGYIFKGGTFELIAVIPGHLYDISAFDLDGDNRLELYIPIYKGVMAYELSSTTNILYWQPEGGDPFFTHRFNSIRFVDPDNDMISICNEQNNNGHIESLSLGLFVEITIIGISLLIIKKQRTLKYR